MSPIMGEAQVIVQDRKRWRHDIVALCLTQRIRGLVSKYIINYMDNTIIIIY